MKNLEINRRATIKASFTADQWQLFEMPGRDEAATDLNRALEQAIAEPNSTVASVYAFMATVREKHAALGAQDSEPDDLIDLVVERVFD